jgi:hypothetical protein
MFKIILFLNTSIYILFFFVVSMNVSLLMCFIEFFEHRHHPAPACTQVGILRFILPHGTNAVLCLTVHLIPWFKLQYLS